MALNCANACVMVPGRATSVQKKSTKIDPDLGEGTNERHFRKVSESSYRRLFSHLIFIVCQTLSGCVKSLINYSAHCSMNSFLSCFPALGKDTKNVQSVLSHTFYGLTSD